MQAHLEHDFRSTAPTRHWSIVPLFVLLAAIACALAACGASPSTDDEASQSSAALSGTTRYEAENATSASTNLPTETKFAGFSGTSYLCCWASQGQFVTFHANAAAAGAFTLAFGYSAGNGNATRQVLVDGAVFSGNETFGATANWSTWRTLSVTANLKSGTNDITVKYDVPSGSSNYINIDYLDVTASGSSSSSSSSGGSSSGGSSSGGPVTNDTDSSIIYSSIGGAAGTWHYGTGDTGDVNGDEHYNNYCQTSGNPSIKGPMAVENFNGTAITLLAAKANNLGIGAWSVDGGGWNNVDAYSSSTSKLHQQALVNVTGLSPGSHVLAFQQTCNKNAASSNNFQVIDGYRIAGSPLSLASASVANKSNGRAAFGGSGWTCGTNSATNLGGIHCWNGTAGATVSWNFTGSLIELFGRPDTGDGLFDVWIDGTRVATNVDGHYGTVDDDALTAYMLWSRKLPSGGAHSIKIVVNGTEDATNGKENSGIKNLVQFDEFVAFP